MQIDMHFYGVYALARLAGMNSRSAYTLAFASQFVDDAIADEAIPIPPRRAILPTMTSHQPLDYSNTIPGDQWKVWVPFHFLPGNDPDATEFLHRMVCRKDSALAKEILDHALRYQNQPFGIHLAGITAHVYADTFAHYGFVGLSRTWNRVDNNSIKLDPSSKSIRGYIQKKFERFLEKIAGTFAELVPVGHGAVATYPDRPYLKWSFKYENHVAPRQYTSRNNPRTFLEASRKLHAFFGRIVAANPRCGRVSAAVPFERLEADIEKILKTLADKEGRIKVWKRFIASGKYFHPTQQDKNLDYAAENWQTQAIRKHFQKGGKDEDCDAALFMRAAWLHRHYVLRELLPDSRIIG
jgi:hypothetical protein